MEVNDKLHTTTALPLEKGLRLSTAHESVGAIPGRKAMEKWETSCTSPYSNSDSSVVQPSRQTHVTYGGSIQSTKHAWII